jgi:hypothetical protein
MFYEYLIIFIINIFQNENLNLAAHDGIILPI